MWGKGRRGNQRGTRMKKGNGKVVKGGGGGVINNLEVKCFEKNELVKNF